MSASQIAFDVCAVAAQIIFAYLCCRIIHKEYKKRKSEAELTISNTYQKWLNRWSMLAMILLTMALAIKPIEKWYPLCKWIYVLSLYFYFQAKVIITFYQIARLQYCFSTAQMHSKYGYSKGWFIFLYMNGVIISIVITCALFIVLFLTKWHPNEYNVCIVADSSSITDMVIPIGVIFFLLWDLTVLICYIIKICQFYRKKDNVQESITLRIKFVVYKIGFLTLIVELLTIISLLVGPAIFGGDVHFILRLITVILLISESFACVYMVYLMIAHNDKEYVMFVKRLDKIRMFCCCKSFVEVALSMDDEIEEEVMENGMTRRTTVDTRTEVETPHMNRDMSMSDGSISE